MMGCAAAASVLLKAHSAEAIRKTRSHRIPARHRFTAADGSFLHVRTTGSQGSGVPVRSMVEANGLIVLPTRKAMWPWAARSQRHDA